MTVQDAFLAGLELVRSLGIPAGGKDIAVIAAHNVFSGRAADKQGDPRFSVAGPAYARNLILNAYAIGGE